MEQTARHILFRGTVQGVGFRYTAHRIARRYNVTGFVRNLPDGDVEMFAQGDELDIDHCLADIQDHFGDYIRDTQIESAPYNSRYTGFRITF
jgi:acylphosphatase